MSKWNTTIDSLLKTGEALATAIVPGAGAVIEAGRSLVETFDHVKEIATADDAKMAELDAGRDALQAKILAHADATEASLR